MKECGALEAQNQLYELYGNPLSLLYSGNSSKRKNGFVFVS